MSKNDKLIWIGINVALLMISICVVPKIIKMSTAKIYKNRLKNYDYNDYDDYEPIIIRKSKGDRENGNQY